jgi:hypothetical protein
MILLNLIYNDIKPETIHTLHTLYQFILHVALATLLCLYCTRKLSEETDVHKHSDIQTSTHFFSFCFHLRAPSVE